MCVIYPLVKYSVYRILEDPTVLSGTLRSTLNIFDEYEDAEIVRDVPSIITS